MLLGSNIGKPGRSHSETKDEMYLFRQAVVITVYPKHQREIHLYQIKQSSGAVFYFMVDTTITMVKY